MQLLKYMIAMLAAFYRDERVKKREQLLIQDKLTQRLTMLHQQDEM